MGRVLLPRDKPLQKYAEQMQKLNALRVEVARAEESRDNAVRETELARTELTKIKDDIKANTALRIQLGMETSALGGHLQGLQTQQSEESGKIPQIQKQVKEAEIQLHKINSKIGSKNDEISLTKKNQEKEQAILDSIIQHKNQIILETTNLLTSTDGIRKEIEDYHRSQSKDEATLERKLQAIRHGLKHLDISARRLNKKAKEIGVNMTYNGKNS